MVLGMTQLLTEMSTRNFTWAVKTASDHTTFMCRLS